LDQHEPGDFATTHFDFKEHDERFYLRASGAGYPEIGRGGSNAARTMCLLSGPGLSGRYAFDFAEITLAGNENKGLIIIASYHRFKDASPRSNYLREFFYRQAAVRK
jgi:hypothetical protein